MTDNERIARAIARAWSEGASGPAAARKECEALGAPFTAKAYRSAAVHALALARSEGGPTGLLDQRGEFSEAALRVWNLVAYYMLPDHMRPPRKGAS